MADVKLNVAGRAYDIHCADGQEDQLFRLAEVIDAKARGVQGGTEVRQLLFAALMLADEAQEAAAKLNDAAPQADALRAAVALAESRAATAKDELRAAAAREKAALDQVKAANTREQAAIAALEAAQQSPVANGHAKPTHDRALLQIADRIEALAMRIAH